MRAAATHTPSPTSPPRVAVLLRGVQTATFSSLRTGLAGGDTGFSTQIQQKFEKKIQTLGLRSSVIGAKDPEKPTKCDGDSVVLSY